MTEKGAKYMSYLRVFPDIWITMKGKYTDVKKGTCANNSKFQIIKQ